MNSILQCNTLHPFCTAALAAQEYCNVAVLYPLVLLSSSLGVCMQLCLCFFICSSKIEAPLALPLTVDVAKDDLWSLENVGQFLQYVAEQHAEDSKLRDQSQKHCMI